MWSRRDDFCVCLIDLGIYFQFVERIILEGAFALSGTGGDTWDGAKARCGHNHSGGLQAPFSDFPSQMSKTAAKMSDIAARNHSGAYRYSLSLSLWRAHPRCMEIGLCQHNHIPI